MKTIGLIWGRVGNHPFEYYRIINETAKENLAGYLE